MILLKTSAYDELVTNVNAIKVSCTSGLLKHSMTLTTRILKNRLKMIKRRYLILVDWLRRPIWAQKLEKLKIKYLVLLV